MTDSDKPRCDNCGDVLSGRGVAGVHGKRYCSHKRACQAARRKNRTQEPGSPVETGDKPRCDYCGDELSGRGTAGVHGKRYCSHKRSCQAARRRNRVQGEVEMEERDCSHCGAWLPSRPKRSSDSALGRWCRDKRDCIKARKRALFELQIAQRQLRDARRLDCPVCGLANTPEWYFHPTPMANGTCYGPEGAWVSGVLPILAPEVWPEQFAMVRELRSEQAATLDSTGP